LQADQDEIIDPAIFIASELWRGLCKDIMIELIPFLPVSFFHTGN
jgi:hypothetical protein